MKRRKQENKVMFHYALSVKKEKASLALNPHCWCQLFFSFSKKFFPISMHILNSFQFCCCGDVNTMGKSSDPCSCLAIHGSHCWFISGVKWFCQSPTWPFLINCLPFLEGISFSLLTYLRRLLLITNVQQLFSFKTWNFHLPLLATFDQKWLMMA